MNKINLYSYKQHKKPIFLILYFAGFAILLVLSINYYNIRNSRLAPPLDQAKTVELPANQTPQTLILNFYSVFSKSPKSRDHLVQQYTTANFQKKYAASVKNNYNLINCGGQYTQLFSLSDGYLDTDKKMVYPLTLQYQPSNTQNTVSVKVAGSSKKYLIDDVICPGADVHVIPKHKQ